MLRTRIPRAESLKYPILPAGRPRRRRRIALGRVIVTACVLYTLVSLAGKLLALLGVL